MAEELSPQRQEFQDLLWLAIFIVCALSGLAFLLVGVVEIPHHFLDGLFHQICGLLLGWMAVGSCKPVREVLRRWAPARKQAWRWR